jgi:pyruvate dehydrogenase E2 component (dihydrolipoamide acetyltransferase)
MTQIFKVPQLGENISEATIVKLYVKVGDTVKKDQILMEVEAGKANLEIQADFDGMITKLLANEGDKILPLGDIVEYEVTVETPQDPIIKEELPAQQTTLTPSEPIKEEKKNNISEEIEVLLPNLGENIAEATVVKVNIKVGDEIKKNEIVLEVETGKASLEITSEYDGSIKAVFVKEGDKIKIGDKIYTILARTEISLPSDKPKEVSPEIKKEVQVDTKIEPKQEKIANTDEFKVDTYNVSKNIFVLASPSVRKFAREIGVTISDVKPSDGKRVTIEDVKQHAKNILQNLGKTEVNQAKIPQSGYFEPLPDFTKWGDIKAEELSNIRRVTAQHLHFSWSQIPHVTQFDKADITDLEEFRLKLVKKYPDSKITITSIIAKVLSLALKKFPQFNSSLDLQNNKLIYKNYYHIGIAVDTDKGLVVPVVRDVDKKSLFDISKDINLLAVKARDKKLSLEEMQGGTFTISNLGGIGGTYFTPIVNYPEVAILGISRSSYEPKYNGTAFEPRLMLPLSLSYDHRVIDGADGIRFLRYIIDILENPYNMLIQL